MNDNSISRIDRRSALRLLSAGGLLFGVAACGGETSDTATTDTSTTSTGGSTTTGGGSTTTGGGTTTTTGEVVYSPLNSVPAWTADTHGKLKSAATAANLTKIFRTDAVQRLDIVIENANWQVMLADLATLKANNGGGIGGGAGGGQLPDGAVPGGGQFPGGAVPGGGQLPDGVNPGGGFNPGAGGAIPDGGAGGIGGGGAAVFGGGVDPITVPCEVFYNGTEWYKVGIRFKGNSSLYGANSKIPFKLKFNEFEEKYPLIAGQRFFGFKTLHLKTNFHDETGMHEALASDLFRKFGVPCSNVGFYKLYVDVNDGTGPQYFGLYSLIEDVEDTLIKFQFGNDSGNLYKPEGDAASFRAGTYDVEEFYIKTNDDSPTYADMKALYDALNDTATYASNQAAWRANLEAAFDMPEFINWLAANTVMVNWDVYGSMAHNYYLYADATDGGRLTWIPWDNNEALVGTRAQDFAMASITLTWPLLYYVAKTPTYFSAYKTKVKSFADSVFNTAAVNPKIEAFQALLADPIASERTNYTYSSASAFTTAVNTLKNHIATRNSAAVAFGSS